MSFYLCVKPALQLRIVRIACHWPQVARSISVGLLLGSGLGVILPEGFHTLSEVSWYGSLHQAAHDSRQQLPCSKPLWAVISCHDLVCMQLLTADVHPSLCAVQSGMEGRIPNWASGAAILAGFMVMLVVHEALSNAQNALGFKDHPSHDRDRELLLTGHRALNSDLQGEAVS